MLKTILITVLLALLAMLVWHLFFPLAGGVLVLSMAAWLSLLAALVFFCLVVPLFFIISSVMIIFALPALAFLVAVLLLVAFPILFPLLLPLWAMLFIVACLRHRRLKAKRDLPLIDKKDQNFPS